MNRKYRRETDKKAKKKLTKDQYQDFKEMTIAECIKLEVDRAIKNFSKEFGPCFLESMKEYNIGKERRENIWKDTLIRMDARIEELNNQREDKEHEGLS